ncbi:MAG TPA: CPBP family glutamic-type intramembrane protease [Candidatus Paceibacterota bacterium]
MLGFGLCVAGYTLLKLAYARKIWDLLGYQWSWGDHPSEFFKAVLIAPILEEFICRLLYVGVTYHFCGLTSVELWEMVGVSSLLFAVGHYDRGFAAVILFYLPSGLSFAMIFILVSEISDVVHAYGVVTILHGAYNFSLCVGPRRTRFLGR